MLLQWETEGDGDTGPSRHPELRIKDTFHSLVRPTWRPRLSPFCRTLTSISQAGVDAAPTFVEVVPRLADFLEKHGLLDADDGRGGWLQHRSRRGRPHASWPRLRRGASWATHGPFDLLHFVVKQAFISQIEGGVPHFMRGPLLDVKVAAVRLVKAEADARALLTPSSQDVSSVDNECANETRKPLCVAEKQRVPAQEEAEDACVAEDGVLAAPKGEGGAASPSGSTHAPRPRSPVRDTTIDGLLRLLNLSAFQGQQHVGIDDTRNIARIVCELGRRAACAAAAAAAAGGSSEDGPTTSDAAAAMAMGEALLPNTRTHNTHLRRWAWMSTKDPGWVVWSADAEVSDNEE